VDRTQILATYDDEYARTYDARFVSNDHYRKKTEFEVEVIGRLLGESGGSWLDVGAATGYYLSRFPGVDRAGLCLSPSVAEVARGVNPDALFLEHGDFTEDVPAWHGRWSLVTCLWYSYGLVASIAAVRRVVENLASWTSEQGACFVPICDPELLGPAMKVPHVHREVGFPPGDVLITGVTWTWVEPSGKRHQDMVAPPVEGMVELFSEQFDSVELVDYPRFKWWGRRRRRGLIARSKTRAR
jgi:hypothetical protein